MASASGSGLPLSVRPAPVNDKRPKDIAAFISLINMQPGGFRALAEAALREEIKARDEAKEDSSQDDVDMTEPDSGGETEIPDLALARLEVLKIIDAAGNAAMLTLDMLSLLVSKQKPIQAGLTLSQQLRDMVGIGTLGVDKLQEPSKDERKTKQARDTALGWTLMEIEKTRDAAEKASSQLQREVQAEGRFWEDIAALKMAGWSICRMPQQRQTLAVKFGFTEVSPEFCNSSLAALRRNSADGALEVDLSRLGGVSEALVVTCEENGQLVGRSDTHRKRPDPSSNESRILDARDTLFAQELWHELLREARTLAAYDVQLEDGVLKWHVDPTMTVSIELRPFESCPLPDDSFPRNNVPDMISMSLHMLLSYAHRHNETARTRPMPPYAPRPKGRQTYTLLRPIIARFLSMHSSQSCMQYMGELIKVLQSAGLAASCKLQSAPLALNGTGPDAAPQSSQPQSVISNMLKPQEFAIHFTFLKDKTFIIRGRTFLFPVTTTHYHILIPQSSLLNSICAPWSEGYVDPKGLAEYFQYAIPRCLVQHFLAMLPDPLSGQWTESAGGTWISGPPPKNMTLRIALERQNERLFVGIRSVIKQPSHTEARNQRWPRPKSTDSESKDVTLEQAFRALVGMPP